MFWFRLAVLCRLHFFNTLKQELNGTKDYEGTSTDETSVVNIHLNELPVMFYVGVHERQEKLLTMYWLPNFVPLLSNLMSFGYYETVYERSRKTLFWSVKKSGEVLSKLKSRGFNATAFSLYDLLTLLTR